MKRGQPKKKWMWLSISEWIIVLLVLGALVFVLQPSLAYRCGPRVSYSGSLRAIMQGLAMYAEKHGERYPAQDQWPSALVEQGVIDEEILVSPVEDGDGISYIYISGLATLDPNQILIYEDPKHWPKRGVLTGFADTTVRFVPFDEFEHMLKAQTQRSGKP